MVTTTDKQGRADRLGYGLIALAFLWRVPAALLGQAAADARIVISSGADSVAGPLALAGLIAGGLYLVVRLVAGWRGRLAAAGALLILTPIGLRVVLTANPAIALGLTPRHWPAWLAAAGALLVTGAIAWRCGRRAVLPLAVLYGLAVAAGSVWAYYRGSISVSDLYLYEQMLWTSLHGPAFMHVTDEGGSHFAVHNSPALLLLLPVYAAWPSGVPIVVLQAAALAATIPLAWRFLAPQVGERAAVVGAVGFGLLPGVLGPVLGKFHEVSFGVPLLLAAALALREGRGRRFALSCAGLLLLRETFGLVVMVLGVGAWRAGRRRWAAAAVIAGAAWLAVSYLVVMPAFTSPTTSTPYRELYPQLGATPGEMARTVLHRPALALAQVGKPANRRWLSEITAPFGGPAPLLTWPGWLGVGEGAAVLAARTGTVWPVRDLFCHYAAIISTGLWLGLFAALAWAARRWGFGRRVLWAGVAACFLFGAAQGLPVVPPTVASAPAAQRQARAAVVAAIPQGSVAAPWDLLPRLSHRPSVIYNDGRQAPTEYVVSLAGQPYQVPGQGYQKLAEYGPYTLWRQAPGR